MSDKKSILVKAILDKTGITKGIKEIQALLLAVHPIQDPPEKAVV